MSRRRPPARSAADRDVDRAVRGELDGVADQVEQHLTQAGGSPTTKSRRIGGDLRVEPQPLVPRPQRATFDRSSRPSDAVELGTRSMASLLASSLEKSSTSLSSASRLIGGFAQGRRDLRWARRARSPADQQIGQADDAVHRRAQLVAHHRRGIARGRGRRFRPRRAPWPDPPDSARCGLDASAINEAQQRRGDQLPVAIVAVVGEHLLASPDRSPPPADSRGPCGGEQAFDAVDLAARGVEAAGVVLACPGSTERWRSRRRRATGPEAPRARMISSRPASVTTPILPISTEL